MRALKPDGSLLSLSNYGRLPDQPLAMWGRPARAGAVAADASTSTARRGQTTCPRLAALIRETVPTTGAHFFPQFSPYQRTTHALSQTARSFMAVKRLDADFRLDGEAAKNALRPRAAPPQAANPRRRSTKRTPLSFLRVYHEDTFGQTSRWRSRCPALDALWGRRRGTAAGRLRRAGACRDYAISRPEQRTFSPATSTSNGRSHRRRRGALASRRNCSFSLENTASLQRAVQTNADRIEQIAYSAWPAMFTAESLRASICPASQPKSRSRRKKRGWYDAYREAKPFRPRAELSAAARRTCIRVGRKLLSSLAMSTPDGVLPCRFYAPFAAKITIAGVENSTKRTDETIPLTKTITITIDRNWKTHLRPLAFFAAAAHTRLGGGRFTLCVNGEAFAHSAGKMATSPSRTPSAWADVVRLNFPQCRYEFITSLPAA